MKKLIKISIQLNSNGFEFLETEWNAEEKIKIYKLSRVDEDGEKVKRVLFKENLNKIQNEYSTSVYMIRFTCVCEPNIVQQIKDAILIKIKERVEHFHNNILSLKKHIENGTT